ncbi:hypothetical protein HK104_008191 [Borealophlyctis nickersoniae]|nr:hypothetical protein HK104_008191 [Borealophlyctis nickersoniae]
MEYAVENVKRNNLEHRITVSLNPDKAQTLPPDLLGDGKDHTVDFCMCNPPFYESDEQLAASRNSKELAPFAVCTGSKGEMVTTGGELQFILQIMSESKMLRKRIRWYTSLVGRKEDVRILVEALQREKIANHVVGELRQAKTVRWVVAWSFFPKKTARMAEEDRQIVASKDTHGEDAAKSVDEAVGGDAEERQDATAREDEAGKRNTRKILKKKRQLQPAGADADATVDMVHEESTLEKEMMAEEGRGVVASKATDGDGAAEIVDEAMAGDTGEGGNEANREDEAGNMKTRKRKKKKRQEKAVQEDQEDNEGSNTDQEGLKKKLKRRKGENRTDGDGAAESVNEGIGGDAERGDATTPAGRKMKKKKRREDRSGNEDSRIDQEGLEKGPKRRKKQTGKPLKSEKPPK